jgi:NMD protein affecting ribosome stability and mRNA decay
MTFHDRPFLNLMTDKISCKECGTLVLPATTKRTNGLCMPCFKKDNPFWPLDISKVQLNLPPTNDEAIKIQKKHLTELNTDLYKILEKEIAAGNNIVETSAGWPKPESIFVMLEKPFMTEINSLPHDIVFNEVNDPHNWKAEFVSESSQHILACRFI